MGSAICSVNWSLEQIARLFMGGLMGTNPFLAHDADSIQKPRETDECVLVSLICPA